MPLTKLTITGADDDTNLEDMMEISWYHRFVEWGILFGKDEKLGTPRYPSMKWITELLTDVEEEWGEIQIAAHLCHPWPQRLANNQLTWKEIALLDQFNRIQINKSYQNTNRDEILNLFRASSNTLKPIIFQNNGTLPVELLIGNIISPFVLFDCSGGKGIEIRKYPDPIVEGAMCGYAGGIGPDNIEKVIKEINEKYPKLNFWLDMETNVRTDEKLDFAKVEQVLEIVNEYIS